MSSLHPWEMLLEVSDCRLASQDKVRENQAERMKRFLTFSQQLNDICSNEALTLRRLIDFCLQVREAAAHCIAVRTV